MSSSIDHEYSSRFWVRVILKALFLFLGLNLLFGILDPMQFLGKLTIYNSFIPGRVRLPYGENPASAYNLSLYNLPAMFASHELAGAQKPPDEYRVILIGDSSTWGYLLAPDETLAAFINQQQLRLPDGRLVRAYNLGYPVMSVTKDLLILTHALNYQPDLIVWPVTLESLPRSKQLFPPLLQNNPADVRKLIAAHDLNLDSNDPGFVEPDFYQKTLVGQRKEIADWLRLQFYGILWAATRIDQELPDQYIPRQEDLSSDVSFHELQPPALSESALALDVLEAGMDLAGNIPVLLINEPMFISQGANSDLRYNFYYPRWAYDAYRELLLNLANKNSWHYLDLWNSVDPTEFTNSAVHMSPLGTNQFAMQIGSEILRLQQP
ncbi:MAG TPA: hypothetical protein VN363_07145 [Anaerolineales bacterium]|nr:hypothetical protein [Anaerolineales bacterium]